MAIMGALFVSNQEAMLTNITSHLAQVIASILSIDISVTPTEWRTQETVMQACHQLKQSPATGQVDFFVSQNDLCRLTE
jgi:hypothetical protein